jgi:tetratricopeptide (TPR) repeat protein
VDAIYLRGLAYMQLKQFPQASSEFNNILDHPGIDPAAFQRPLAHLQLARVLVQEGNRPASVKEYGAFLSAWQDADAREPLVVAAHAELAALRP